MTPADLIVTAVLLGVFVAAGGAYGILYAAAMLRDSANLARAARACYVLQLLITLAVCAGSPLALLWKLFIAASAAAYGFIPPLMWRLLEAMHRTGKETRLP
ncbi:MAG TPA: hypothetical protein VLX90_15270 [Steroidobacteraceae bacterium]|nr:hypothetical protein [Steroidobacteraceae bacterium]